jgi:hypothetical protein
MFPVFCIATVSGTVGFSVRFLLSPGFIRLGVTIIACEFLLFPLSWFVLFDSNERRYFTDRLQKIISFKK